MEDLIKPHFPTMTETKATFLSKGLGQTSSSWLLLFVLLCCCVVLCGPLPCELPDLMMKCDCSTALVYGLVCLAMAYLASLMGSVLQVPPQRSSGFTKYRNLFSLPSLFVDC